MHQREGRADGLDSRHRAVDLLGRGHARRDDHRLALSGDVALQREVGQLSRAGLEDRQVERLEKIGRLARERRGEKQDALAGREVAQRVVRLRRKGRARQQVEQRLADIRRRRAIAQHLVLGKVGLKLDRIGTGLGGRLHELGGDLHVAVMVDPGFRDDEARAAAADLAIADRQDCAVVCHGTFTLSLAGSWKRFWV